MQVSGRIKVAYLLPTLDVGGTEKHVLDVIDRLDRNVFSPKLCCISGGGLLEREVERQGIEATILREDRVSPKRICCYVRQRAYRLMRLYRYLRQERPDIVHCYLFPTQIWGGLAAKIAGVPILLTSRRGLGIFKDHKPHLQWIENQVNRMTDMVIANSEAVRNDVLRRERIFADKVRVIHNGVDIPAYSFHARSAPERHSSKREEFGIPQDVPVIGMIANLIPYKGHREFLLAAAEVQKQHTEAHFVCVGQDRGIRSELEQFANALDIRHLHFAGVSSEIRDWLAAFDVYVSASHEEGFSNAILEAMAAGIPIIATAVGGTPEAIRDHETGLLIPPCDATALAHAIYRLLSEHGDARRLAENARKYAQQRFSTSRMMAELEQTYLELFAMRIHS